MDCPACGSPVTLETGSGRPLSTSLSDAVLAAEEDERIEVIRDCWDCGWYETRELRVALIDTTAGNEPAVKRATLVDEVTNELATIDSVETLEEALAAIRRRRRTGPATTGTDDDATECLEMPDAEPLYDVREQTGNPDHESVDDVVNLVNV